MINNFFKFILFYLLVSFDVYGGDVYFQLVGDESTSQLRASYDVYESGDRFTEVVSVLESLISIAQNQREPEFNKQFSNQIVLGDKDLSETQKRWFKNMGSVTKFEPSSVIVNGEYRHLTTKYTLKDDRSFTIREDFKCIERQPCKFYLGDGEIDQDFERIYSAYKQALKKNQLLAFDSSFTYLGDDTEKLNVLIRRDEQLDSVLLSEFLDKFKQYHQKIVITYNADTQQAYEASILDLFGIESGGKNDRFIGVNWVNGTPEIRRSDFGIYSEGIRDLGEAPKVIDYFADSLDNKKIYFVVASAKSKSNIQVIAYDRAGAEIINPRRERSFRIFLSPSLLMHLSKYYTK